MVLTPEEVTGLKERVLPLMSAMAPKGTAVSDTSDIVPVLLLAILEELQEIKERTLSQE